MRSRNLARSCHMLIYDTHNLRWDLRPCGRPHFLGVIWIHPPKREGAADPVWVPHPQAHAVTDSRVE